jgi:hypothetical protein
MKKQRKVERKKLGKSEDEKVSRSQSAWGMGHRAEGRRGMDFRHFTIIFLLFF